MSKHTPGKWLADFDGEHWNVIVEGGEGFGRDIVGCEGLYRCDGSDEANARLIAAAPAMLEALMEAIDCGMVPVTSAKEGGAATHSRQVKCADMIREAIRQKGVIG